MKSGLLLSCLLLARVLASERKNDDDDIERLLVDDNYSDSMFFHPDLSSGNRIYDTDPSEEDEALNCFGIGLSVAGYIDNWLTKEPNGTKALKSVFHATSRKQPHRKQMKFEDWSMLNNIDFDITRRTVFIVPGFMSGSGEQWTVDMEQALLKWGNVNVFIVDWSEGSNTINYLKASVNTKTVGDQIATFVGQLINHNKNTHKVPPSKWGTLHFIGHSLGAHICGYAAHELKRRESKWLAYRITGLDPAQPCFRNSNLRLRLDRGDAPFVDIVHTNGRLLKKLGLGLPYPLGHVDFYPNGGAIQPGCLLSKSSIWNYIPLPISKLTKIICSHGRSQIYLIESIISAVEKNCTFWAHDWDLTFEDVDELISVDCDRPENHQKCVEMGINAEKYARTGTYFTVTSGTSPYCRVDDNAVEEAKNMMEKYKTKVAAKSGAASRYVVF